MNDRMSIDQADALRTRLLTGYVAAFAVWGGALAATMVFVVGPGVGTAPTPMPVPPRPVLLALVAAQLAGFLVWGVFLLRLALLARRVRRDPELRAAARDERSLQNQRRSMLLAFWAVTIVAGATIPLEVAFGITLTASTLASVIVWLGPTVGLAAYVMSERRDAA